MQIRSDCKDPNEENRMSFSTKSGGFLPSLVTLGSSMIGMGFLTLPQIGKHNGTVPMVAMILISVAVCLVANLQISRAYYHTKQRTFAEIVEYLEGPRVAKVATFFIMVYIYVVSTLFYVFIPQFVLSFLDNTNSRPDWLTSERTFSVSFIALLFPINFLCSLTPKLSSLKSQILRLLDIALGSGDHRDDGLIQRSLQTHVRRPRNQIRDRAAQQPALRRILSIVSQHNESVRSGQCAERTPQTRREEDIQADVQLDVDTAHSVHRDRSHRTLDMWRSLSSVRHQHAAPE